MKIDQLAKMIPAEAEPIVLELLDRLGRLRAHPDDESGLIEKLVRRSQRQSGSQYHKWTPDEDRTLLRVQFRPRGVAEFAIKIGVSEPAAWMRLDRLRKKLRGGASPVQVEG